VDGVGIGRVDYLVPVTAGYDGFPGIANRRPAHRGRVAATMDTCLTRRKDSPSGTRGSRGTTGRWLGRLISRIDCAGEVGPVGQPRQTTAWPCKDGKVTQPSDPPAEEQALAFLRELVDRYGVDGLQDRLSAAIDEAEAGRVAGLALDEATDWIEEDHGDRLEGFVGHGRLTVSPATVFGAAAFGGSGTLSGVGEVVTKAAQDAATAVDQAALSVTETAQVVITNLPTNLQVLTMVHDTFLYLTGLWGLLNVPVEAIPFGLLITLAIVIARIRIKQSGD
jgi:hypothetical protein